MFAPDRRRRRRQLSTVSLAAGAALVLSACAGGGGGEPSADPTAALEDFDPITIKVAELSPERGSIGDTWKVFQAEITEKTDGKITFENFWAGSLLGAVEISPGVADGVADMGWSVPSYYPEDLPISSWMMGLGNDVGNSAVHAVVAGTAATMQTQLTSQAIQDEYAAYGLKLILPGGSSQYKLLCAKPVNSVEEAVGLRIRSSGPIWSAAIEEIGAVPVNIPLTEAYEGLQRGVIDCVALNIGGITIFGLQEVAPYFVPVSFAQLIGSGFVMNLDVWESLPVEVQGIIFDAAGSAAKELWLKYIAQEAVLAADFVENGGNVVVAGSADLDDAIGEARQSWLDAMVESAPAGLADPQELIDAYTENLNYWIGVLENEGFGSVGNDPEEIAAQYNDLSDIDLDAVFEKFKTEALDPNRP